MSPPGDRIMRARRVAAERWQYLWRLRAEIRIALMERRAARHRTALAARRAAISPSDRDRLWEICPAAGDTSPTPEALARQIVRVVEAHPDGIGPVDVGNQLGVDWRQVVDAARHLVDGGRIEHIGDEWYPPGKRIGNDEPQGPSPPAA